MSAFLYSLFTVFLSKLTASNQSLRRPVVSRGSNRSATGPLADTDKPCALLRKRLHDDSGRWWWSASASERIPEPRVGPVARCGSYCASLGAPVRAAATHTRRTPNNDLAEPNSCGLCHASGFIFVAYSVSRRCRFFISAVGNCRRGHSTRPQRRWNVFSHLQRGSDG